MSVNTTNSEGAAQARALGVAAASCFADSPAEYEGVKIDTDGRPVIEYRHTLLDDDALAEVASSVAGRLAGVVGRIDLAADRVEIIGYSPIDPDSPAVKYHLRPEWSVLAGPLTTTTGDPLLERIAETGEQFVEIEEIGEVCRGGC